LGAAGAVLLAAGLLVGCAERPVPSVERRTIEDSERAVRYVIPPRWLHYDDEIRSPSGTIFTVEALSLADADPEFLKALPESIVPQIEKRTRYFFSIVGPHADRKTTVADEPALEVTFPVQIRDRDKPSKVIYWVVRVGQRLYTLRVTYPPGAETEDAPAAKQLLDSLKFL